MTLAALTYVVAASLAFLAVLLRADPRIARRLGVTAVSAGSPRSLGRPPRARRGVPRPEDGVPDLLDAVAVCVGAGLTPRLAVEQAATVLRGPLADELERIRRAAGLGTPWRSALGQVAERIGLPELRRLAGVFERSERLGSPVADHLRRLARDVREERRVRHEERARRAPVAMLFPLVLCILPAFVLAAVVPAVLAAARDIG